MTFKKPFRAAPIVLGPRYRDMERRIWRITVIRILVSAVIVGVIVAIASLEIV